MTEQIRETRENNSTLDISPPELRGIESTTSDMPPLEPIPSQDSVLDEPSQKVLKKKCSVCRQMKDISMFGKITDGRSTKKNIVEYKSCLKCREYVYAYGHALSSVARKNSPSSICECGEEYKDYLKDSHFKSKHHLVRLFFKSIGITLENNTLDKTLIDAGYRPVFKELLG